MSSFGRRIDGPGGRRRIKRREVAILGSVMSLEGSKSIVVEDLGLTGAKLVGRDLPPPGKEVLIRTDRHRVLGRVAWADHDYRGVIFDAPLPEVAEG